MTDDLITRLRERAIAARDEGTGTAIGDALHFEEAADTLERYKAALEAAGNVSGEFVASLTGRGRNPENCLRIDHDELRAIIKKAGHGHVIPRPDGGKARCGGPALCEECRLEKAALNGEPS